VYVALPAQAGEPPKRLVGWNKVWLRAGESQEIHVAVPEKYLSIYDEATGWKKPLGDYKFMVGGSSADLPLTAEVAIVEVTCIVPRGTTAGTLGIGGKDLEN
jgi:beta-glucosidase